jgi:tRNA G18 (ribose-2'-O)-methylase SpoU
MPIITAIDDPADPRIAAYRDVRERDLVGRQGLIIAEGEVVLRVLVNDARHRPQSLLVAEKRLAALKPLIDKLPAETPVYSAGQAVLNAIAGFPLHRGVLAVAEKAPEPEPQLLLAGLPTRAVVVVLFGVSNHDNIGGIFRNAAAFGADAVLLDTACCDPLYRKAIRVSVGASLRLPFARLPQGLDVVGLLQAHGFTPLGLTPAA